MKPILFKNDDRVSLINESNREQYGSGVVVSPCKPSSMLTGVSPNLVPVEFYVTVQHDNKAICNWHQESLTLEGN